MKEFSNLTITQPVHAVTVPVFQLLHISVHPPGLTIRRDSWAGYPGSSVQSPAGSGVRQRAPTPRPSSCRQLWRRESAACRVMSAGQPRRPCLHSLGSSCEYASFFHEQWPTAEARPDRRMCRGVYSLRSADVASHDLQIINKFHSLCTSSKAAAIRGVARMLHWGAQKLSALRCRRRQAGRDWGQGVPLPNWLGALGERRELPQRSPSRQPIFGIFEAHRTLLVERTVLLYWIMYKAQKATVSFKNDAEKIKIHCVSKTHEKNVSHISSMAWFASPSTFGYAPGLQWSKLASNPPFSSCIVVNMIVMRALYFVLLVKCACF